MQIRKYERKRRRFSPPASGAELLATFSSVINTARVNSSERYSQLREINTTNVGKLKVLCTYGAGIGASTILGSGDVYNFTNVAPFHGAYAEGRYGFAFGQKSASDLWMKNENGVVIHPKADRTGLMPSLGGSAAVISMSQ